MVKKYIYSLYSIFSKSIDSSYVCKFTEKTDRLVSNFIDTFEKRGVSRHSLGITFLYDYFCDSYNYWTNSGRELRTVPLSWVIGQPQIKRWDRRYENYKYSYTEGFLSHTQVPGISEIKSTLCVKEGVDDVSEDYERSRFHNQASGFINCILSTSLVVKGGRWCDSCIFRDECIEELRVRNPELALSRGFIELRKHGK